MRLLDELVDLRIAQADLLERGGMDLELDREEEALQGNTGEAAPCESARCPACPASTLPSQERRENDFGELTGIFSSASLPTVTSASTVASFGSGFASLCKLPCVAPIALRKQVA